MNLRRTLTLAGIGGISLGLVAMYGTPRPKSPPIQDAPIVKAFYAPPLERIQTEKLNDGETLSGLLSRASITGMDLTGLLLSLREHRNPRMLKPGVEVTVRSWIASGQPRAVEVRLNADTTVKLVKADDGWDSHVVLTQTHVDTVFAAGHIEEGRSLYESILEDDALTLPVRERTELVGQLAGVFQYSLDFSRDIQPGDTYRFMYEREARPDGTARSRKILAAEVNSQGKPYTAYFFKPTSSSQGNYYDASGKPLKRSISLYPIDFVRITSRFAWSRYHPILGIFRAHLGTDFGAAIGTPVKATGDGVVVSAGYAGGYGNLVVLRHQNGYLTKYGHLSRFARGLRRGKRVSQGQVIAYVGNTGMSTGPHLHYEVRDASGHALNVARLKLPPSGALSRAQLRVFRGAVQQRMALLAAAGSGRGAHLAQTPQPRMRPLQAGE